MGNDGRSSLSSSDELNLYSSRHYDTDKALCTDFTKATGIKIIALRWVKTLSSSA